MKRGQSFQNISSSQLDNHIGKEYFCFYFIHKNLFQMDCKSKRERLNKAFTGNKDLHDLGVGKFFFNQDTPCKGKID